MTRLGKDELLTKISEKVTDENIAIELMEDVSDSIELDTEIKRLESELESVKAERDEAKSKYKERFLTGSPVVKEDVIDEPKMVNYVDIKTI